MKRLDLTDRDINILNMVYYYDGIGYEQLQRAFFNGLSKNRMYQRIPKLVEYGYLQAVPIRSRHHNGSGILFYILGKQGKSYLSAIRDERSLHAVSKDPEFIDHHLATCNFRLAVETGCNQLGIGLEEWVTERELYRRKTNPTPDGEFTLWYRGKRFKFRLETDRATVMPQRMREKLSAYYKTDCHDPVLWIVPTLKRATDIEKWAGETAAKVGGDSTVHWIALHGQDPFSPVWKIVGGPDHVGLL